MEEEQEFIYARLHTTKLLTSPLPGEPHSKDQDYCTLRMVGKTREDLDVCLFVEGFFPYFFLELPHNWIDCHVSELRSYIIENGKNMHRDLVECSLQQSGSTYGFSDGQLFPFAKLSFRGEKSMRTCMYMFQNVSRDTKFRSGVAYEPSQCYPIQLSEFEEPVILKPCEHQNQIPVLLKTIHDTFIQPNGWIRIPKSAYQVIENVNPESFNMCLRTKLNQIEPITSDDIPKFVECCFDGEMVSPSFEFPRPKKRFDCVTQLGVDFQRYGELEPYRRILFCLDEMGDVSELGSVKVEVRCSKREEDLLMDFVRVLLKENPDILTGYNINKFDIPYLLQRAEFLGLPEEFFVLGRFPREKTELVESFRSKLKGHTLETKKQYNIPIIGGRRIEDCLESVKNSPKKLSSYKLDFVANFYLGVGKNDVEPEDIFRAYQNTTDPLISEASIGYVKAFLGRLRIMRAFELVTRRGMLVDGDNPLAFKKQFAKTFVLQKVSENWPVEYRTTVARSLSDWVFNTKSYLTYDETTKIVDNYVQEVKRGYALVLGRNVEPISSKPEWYCNGITLENLGFASEDKAEKLSSTKKRERRNNQSPEKEKKNRDDGYFNELFLDWEKRVVAEIDVLTFVTDHKTTRNFAEKWWRIQQELKELEIQKKEEAEAFLDKEIKKHRQWHFDQKTRVGRYCMQDASLPLRLRNEKQFLISALEMSKATRVPCNMLFEKGQTIKVINLVLLWARKNNYVVTVRILPQPPFVGGRVLKPKPGFYRRMVFTLDYNSLYPSLIQANMLCYLTLILEKDLEKYLNRPDLEIREDKISDDPNIPSYHWVTNKRACLPEILKDLVGERSAVKAELEKETDPKRKVILDQRQLALKLSGNSVYGFTGYEHSPWPCMPIAVCTTVHGRGAIDTAEKMAIDKYGAEVIYGDSVTGDTPLLLLTPNNQIVIQTIASLSSVWESYPQFKPRDADRFEKEQAPLDGWMIWTYDRASGDGKGKWTPIKRVIRHKTAKKIFRLLTQTGCVDVTEDHSLLDDKCNVVKPGECNVGTSLLHAVYDSHCCFRHEEMSLFLKNLDTHQQLSVEEQKAFVQGFFFGDGSCGAYFSKWGTKYSWSIDDKDVKYLNVLKVFASNVYKQEFKILESNGVYKLIPVGTIKNLVTEYNQYYNENREKIVPPTILNGTSTLKKMFFYGYYCANGSKYTNEPTKCIRFDIKGKTSAAHLFYLMRSIGFNCNINTKYDKPLIFRITAELTWICESHPKKPTQQIKKIDCISKSTTEEFVYDIETEEGYFQAGVGELIVKNTDSIMCIVPIPAHLSSVPDQLEYVFKIAIEAAAYISSAFKKPMKLAFEKVYFPYLLLRKKGYSGLMWTKSDKPDKLDTKGIEAVRRDNPPLLRNTMINMLKTLMETMDVSKACRVARKAFQKVAEQKVSWADLTVTKKLGDDYKNEKQIQLVVSEYLHKHHPLLAPEVGDRVPFCYVKVPDQKKQLQSKAYLKAYNPVLAEREGKEPDWKYYCYNCLKKPFDRIFCVALGYQYIKGKTVQPTDHLWEPYLTQICENDVDQSARIGFVPLPFLPKKPKVEVIDEDEEGLPLPEKPQDPPKKTKMKNADIRAMFGRK